MKNQKAIFDKRFFEKKTIMALYATKILFPAALFLVIMYKNGKRKSLVIFIKDRKPIRKDAGCESSLCMLRAGFGLS